ncbi:MULTISPECIES: hypothetical protein [unclassified Rickettsia]|uniref:hypothetical protein n=1 Tax=unclassified Rickettsia TaxID=114295 RepID=UPI003132B749
MLNFNRTNAIVKLLRDNPGKKFTGHEIAAWLGNTYPEEIIRKEQMSKNKILLGITDKAIRKKFVIKLIQNEFNSNFRTALQKKEPKIKITDEYQPKYYYIDKIANYESTIHKEFDLKSIVIKFLRDNLNKEFTNSQIATSIINMYPEEAEQKVQISDYKLSKEEIAILLHKEVDSLCMTIQKIEPKIKIIENGCWTKYCYIDNTDKIFDKFKVIKTLESHKQQEFTAHEMAQLLLGTNSR